MDSLFLSQLNSEPSKSDIDFLYKLLSQRKFFISHKKLPTYEEHSNFVRSHPYYKWFLVKLSSINIGSIYINIDNSVGVHFLSDYLDFIAESINILESTEKPQIPILSVRPSYFFYNVHPDDSFMNSILSELGFQVSKISYRKMPIVS